MNKSRANSDIFCCWFEFVSCKVQGINVPEPIMLATNKKILKIHDNILA